MNENRIQFLRPGQIKQLLAACPLIYIPIGPLEWHGPHLPYGMDPLNAENVARRASEVTGGLVWPTLFWGTERERRPQQAEYLGFPADSYIVGMDFPTNPLPSAYCPEEVFAVLMREVLREARALGARLAVLVNGHGAINHNQVLHRLATEFNHTTDLTVHVRLAFTTAEIERGEIGHATSIETSMMMNIDPALVDVSTLPPLPTPLRYEDFGIVDGLGFDGKGAAGRIVQEDPRRLSSAEQGREVTQRTVGEVVEEVKQLLKRIDEQSNNQVR